MTVIVLRFLEYAAGAVLFGAPLFLLYSGLDELHWTRRLVLAATLILAAAVPLHFLAEAAEMAGSPSALPDGATLEAVFRETVFGKSSLVRAVAV
ncbi:MAG TPA: hypothetical protein VG501_06430, partial [Rhizomicrobium sp.]|nr:hypothetical protein [Rhizomicrobium sp.]